MASPSYLPCSKNTYGSRTFLYNVVCPWETPEGEKSASAPNIKSSSAKCHNFLRKLSAHSKSLLSSIHSYLSGPSEKIQSMTSSRSRLISTAAKNLRAVAQRFGGCLSEAEEEIEIEEDPEVLLWLKEYSLDLPPHISQDRSELDYLRRKNRIDSDIHEDEIGYMIRKRSEALLGTNPNTPEDRIGYLIRQRSGALLGIGPDIPKDENKNLRRYGDAAVEVLHLEQQPGKNHDYGPLCISIRDLEKVPSILG